MYKEIWKRLTVEPDTPILIVTKKKKKKRGNAAQNTLVGDGLLKRNQMVVREEDQDRICYTYELFN